MKRPPSRWTLKTIATLARMTRAGANSAQIAAALGNGITRNAILGKIHRLRSKGTALPTSAATPALKPKPKPKPKPRLPARQHSLSYGFGARTTPDAPPRPVVLSFYDTVDPLTPGLLRLEDLQLHDCRWPLNSAMQGEYFFCGAPQVLDRPYCPAHVALAYDNRNKRQGAA